MESASNKATLAYHDLFDYPLMLKEIEKWKTDSKINIKNKKVKIQIKDNYIFLKGRQNIIEKRLQNENYSKQKLKIAKRAANLLSKIPSIKFIGITGSLAMMNASQNSDIDLMIITKINMLWITRLLVYSMLRATSYILRQPRVKNERDALCLNLWLDEQDLIWQKADRNIYTAHEIAQIVPLVNKDKTFEKLLWQNRWVLDYWPNSIEVGSMQHEAASMQKYMLHSTCYFLQAVEKFAFKLQYIYMKPKITREVVTPTRAIFHPVDWSSKIISKLFNN